MRRKYRRRGYIVNILSTLFAVHVCVLDVLVKFGPPRCWLKKIRQHRTGRLIVPKRFHVPVASITKAINACRFPLIKLEEANGDCRPGNTIFRQSGFLADGRQSSTT